MNGFIARFLSDERGATAIEYGLICGLIFVAILGGLNALGGPTAPSTKTSCRRSRTPWDADAFPQRDQAGSPSSPVNSLTPKASASRTLAEPRGSGFCWLSCGFQPAR